MARVVFMGTPAFAVPSLQALAHEHTVAGVVTQPDRPAGRGRPVTASPVKQFAQAAGLPIIQPTRLREPGAMAQLAGWAPEVIVVAAFGQILRPEVLDLPPHGCLNVHASLLPRHRGAAPIAAAILAGDAKTGITLMKMDRGLDTGPIVAQQAVEIDPDDTAQSLADRLAPVGARLLTDTLPAYLTGQVQPRLQDDAQATYAPQLKKEDGHLDFTRPAAELARRVRAFTPWPGAFAWWPQPDGGAPRQIKVLRVAVREQRLGQAGEVAATSDGPAVACSPGALLLLEVQPPGKRPMMGSEFARGARDFLGARLV